MRRNALRLGPLFTALFPAAGCRGVKGEMKAPMHARLRRRIVSFALALLLGASALACNTGGGASAPSARGDSRVKVAAADYGASASNITPDYAGHVTREAQQTDLEASAEKAKAALRESGSSVP